jgi:hypothetical protein
MNYQRLLKFFAGLTILLALLVVDQWIFSTWFKTTHLNWYLANGALIGLVTSITSMAWGDMSKHIGLISPNPFDYIGACLQLAGLPIYTLGTHLRRNKNGYKPQALFDLILTIPFLIVLVGMVVIWIVVIVPLQYFLYLVCGAPARILSQSKQQPIAQIKGTQLKVSEIGSAEKVPEGWWSASISQKPIAITNLFVSLFFLIFKSLIG